MQTIIRQTIFQAQPLQNVVGVGNTTAYQIEISEGPRLGMFGSISVPAEAEVLNDTAYSRNAAQASGRVGLVSWVHRALATLQS